MLRFSWILRDIYSKIMMKAVMLKIGYYISANSRWILLASIACELKYLLFTLKQCFYWCAYLQCRNDIELLTAIIKHFWANLNNWMLDVCSLRYLSRLLCCRWHITGQFVTWGSLKFAIFGDRWRSFFMGLPFSDMDRGVLWQRQIGAPVF